MVHAATMGGEWMVRWGEAEPRNEERGRLPLKGEENERKQKAIKKQSEHQRNLVNQT